MTKIAIPLTLALLLGFSTLALATHSAQAAAAPSLPPLPLDGLAYDDGCNHSCDCNPDRANCDVMGAEGGQTYHEQYYYYQYGYKRPCGCGAYQP